MSAIIYFKMTVDKRIRGLFSKRSRQRHKSYKLLKRLWEERKSF
jgi:hypothetical protein